MRIIIFLILLLPTSALAQQSLIYTTDGTDVTGADSSLIGRDSVAGGVFFTPAVDYVNVTGVQFNLLTNELENLPFGSTAVSVLVYEVTGDLLDFDLDSLIAASEPRLLTSLTQQQYHQWNLNNSITLSANQSYLIYLQVQPVGWTYPTSQAGGLIVSIATELENDFSNNRYVRVQEGSPLDGESWEHFKTHALFSLVVNGDLYNPGASTDTYDTRFTDVSFDTTGHTGSSNVFSPPTYNSKTVADVDWNSTNAQEEADFFCNQQGSSYVSHEIAAQQNGDFSTLNWDSSFYETQSYAAPFISITCSSATNQLVTDLNLTVDYFINLSEIDTSQPEYNLSTLSLTLIDPNQQILTTGHDITPLTQGNSQSVITAYDLVDGFYEVFVRFGNLDPGNTVTPFEQSEIITGIQIQNGIVSIVEQSQFTDGTAPVVEFEDSECGITNLSGCIVNAVAFLFIPDQSVLDTFMTTVTNSDNPLIDSANQSFEQITTVSDATAVSAPLSYTLDIPQAGVNVEMFSVDRMTYLMGDAKPIFRSIMDTALWFGFIGMLISSVWRRIGDGDDSFDGSLANTYQSSPQGPQDLDLRTNVQKAYTLNLRK